VSLLISENTREAVPEYACREIDRVRVKGRDRPVTIYEPLCLREDLDSSWKDEIKVYKQALKYYREQAWDLAELQFLNLCKTSRAPAPYQVYAERIAYFRKNPPPLGWDGVFTHTEK
jgi:adenylate cyclase